MAAEGRRCVASSDTIFLDGGDGCFFGIGMLGHSEVVCGSVVNAIVYIFVIVEGEDIG